MEDSKKVAQEENKKIVEELAQEMNPEDLKKLAYDFQKEQEARAKHRAEVKHYLTKQVNEKGQRVFNDTKNNLITLVSNLDWDVQQLQFHIADLNKKIDELLKNQKEG